EHHQSELTRFLREEARIESPGSQAAVYDRPIPPIPAAVLDDFKANDLPRIKEHVRDQLKPLTGEIARAADDRGRPAPRRARHPEGDGIDAARRLVEISHVRFAPISLRSKDPKQQGRELWGLSFADLGQRIAFELFELYTSRPKLGRCWLCGRAYIPSRGKPNYCGAQLWHSETNHGEWCNQQAVDTFNSRVTDGA